ncbi:MAG: hypothetical protein ACLQRH_16070 [Acidimicrobiales bacterium]
MTETTIAGEAQSREHEVEIEVNYRRVRVPERVTGAAIKEAAHIDLTFDLYRIEGGDEIPVGNDEEIKVHHDAKFVATPGLEPA